MARLLRVEIKTREPVPDFLFPRWQKLSLWVRDILRLEAVPDLSVDDSTKWPETTVTFTYDCQTADAADFNQGPGDVEGEVVALVQECLGLSVVQKVVKKVDLTLA